MAKRFVNKKSKDILEKRSKSLKLKPLKIQNRNESDAFRIESEYIGAVAPFILFNDYTFNYKLIDSLILEYRGILPDLQFVIHDQNGEFSAITLPTEGDEIYLYLKPHAKKFKEIYIQFEVVNYRKYNSYHSFNCIPKIPFLFDEKCVGYENKSMYELLDSLSDELKLGFSSNIDSTSDKMNRIRAVESPVQFINREIKTTYKSEDTFFTWFIDFYYNLNFVELNNQFGKYKEQESVASLIQPQSQHGFSKDEDVFIDGKLIISNAQQFRGTSNFIYDYDVVNNTGEIKIQNGYDRYSQFFDTDLDKFETQKVEPVYENEDPAYKKLRQDSPDAIKYKYTGIQITSKNSKNVHDNYEYAKILNHQNIEEIDKLHLIARLDKANFHIYRYMSIPVALYEFDQLNIDKVGVRNGIEIEDKKDYPILLEQYSGHYVVKNIRYTYDKQDLCIKQELDLIRREWPLKISK